MPASANDWPDLLQEYSEFCRVKGIFKREGSFDLSEIGFCLPAFLLCTKVFLADNANAKIVPPKDKSVSTYFDFIMKHPGIGSAIKDTYVPPAELPHDPSQSEAVLEKLRKVHNDGEEYGGQTAFNYLMSEIVDNIYQHSKFCHAFLMAQKYPSKRFVEIAFIDDGITIPGSFEKAGKTMQHINALKAAMQGKSTKDQTRGYGLSTSLKLVTKGLNGQFLLVSGKAALYYKPSEQTLYTLDLSYELKGTLVGLRIPYPCPKLEDIYEYTE